jgi:hypothetical protein
MSKSTAVVVSLPDTPVLEDALLGISGVQGVHIVQAETNDIGEIHIIASPRRSPKKVVRDIESLLVVRYGYRIDYRRISLVQLNDSSLADRISLGRVEQIQQPEGKFIEVELRNGEQRYVACAVLEDDDASAAAKATVEALNALFSPRAPLTLSGTLSSTIGPRDIVTAYVTFQETTVEHALGTTFVRNSTAEAAARAVLAATNRRIAAWLSEQRVVPVTDLIAI